MRIIHIKMPLEATLLPYIVGAGDKTPIHRIERSLQVYLLFFHRTYQPDIEQKYMTSL